MRLAKFLAHAGVASRRGAESLIEAGRVSVAGEVVTDPARDVDESSDVRVDGDPLRSELLEHYLLNKPTGVVSTADDPQGRRKVTDLIESKARLYPVGRLDYDSSGLLIMTNDGALANLLTHPRYEVEKTYRTTITGQVSDHELKRLVEGVWLDDGQTAPAQVRLVERSPLRSTIELTIREGRKRQVRRMCEAIGHRVVSLERIKLGPIELGKLPVGGSRRLTADEVELLRLAAGDG